MLEKRRHVALGLLFVLATSPLFGQTPLGMEEESVAEGSFGLGNQDTFVAAPSFQPTSLTSSWAHGGHGYWAEAAGNLGTFHAPLSLPAGARITVITCYFFDNDPSGTATVNLLRFGYNTSTEESSATGIGPAILSVDAGGNHRVFESFDETVRYRPSLFTRQFYTLSVTMPPATGVRFRGCNVTWNRQVSPAPASATFADVPVGHPYHQFIEALVDSGITAGCGGGLYCVNAPITRGEMAVFLAAALGLHFPN
jgi:hypothetical protein